MQLTTSADDILANDILAVSRNIAARMSSGDNYFYRMEYSF